MYQFFGLQSMWMLWDNFCVISNNCENAIQVHNCFKSFRYDSTVSCTIDNDKISLTIPDTLAFFNTISFKKHQNILEMCKTSLLSQWLVFYHIYSLMCWKWNTQIFHKLYQIISTIINYFQYIACVYDQPLCGCWRNTGTWKIFGTDF